MNVPKLDFVSVDAALNSSPGHELLTANGIKSAVVDFQTSPGDWRYSEVSREVIYRYVEALLVHVFEPLGFGDLLRSEKIVVQIENKGRALGYAYRDRDGFGFPRTIGLAESLVKQPEANAVIFETLGHELIHVLINLETLEGKAKRTKSPNYHNARFRYIARQLGIHADSGGHHLAIEPDSLLVQGMREVAIPEYQIQALTGAKMTVNPPKRRERTEQRYVAYRCKCNAVGTGRRRPATTIYASRGTQAKCLKCGSSYVRA